MSDQPNQDQHGYPSWLNFTDEEPKPKPTPAEKRAARRAKSRARRAASKRVDMKVYIDSPVRDRLDAIALERSGKQRGRNALIEEIIADWLEALDSEDDEDVES